MFSGISTTSTEGTIMPMKLTHVKPDTCNPGLDTYKSTAQPSSTWFAHVYSCDQPGLPAQIQTIPCSYSEKVGQAKPCLARLSSGSRMFDDQPMITKIFHWLDSILLQVQKSMILYKVSGSYHSIVHVARRCRNEHITLHANVVINRSQQRRLPFYFCELFFWSKALLILHQGEQLSQTRNPCFATIDLYNSIKNTLNS